MVPTIVVVAAFISANDPHLPELIKLPSGAGLQIPCAVREPKEAACVQLYVSDNRGATWALYSEIAPDKDAFVFFPKRGDGEYWFTARVKKKDGTFDPTRVEGSVPMQRVRFGDGAEKPVAAPTQPARQYADWTPLGVPSTPAPTVSPIRPKSAMQEVDELAEDLTRLEIALIRKEIKRLAEEKELTQETTDKIDRLRSRLRDLRHQLRDGDNNRGSTSGTPAIAPAGYTPSPMAQPSVPLPPIPYVPDDRMPTDIGPSLLPIPLIPSALPEAPMPRARARR